MPATPLREERAHKVSENSVPKGPLWHKGATFTGSSKDCAVKSLIICTPVQIL